MKKPSVSKPSSSSSSDSSDSESDSDDSEIVTSNKTEPLPVKNEVVAKPEPAVATAATAKNDVAASNKGGAKNVRRPLGKLRARPIEKKEEKPVEKTPEKPVKAVKKDPPSSTKSAAKTRQRPRRTRKVSFLYITYSLCFFEIFLWYYMQKSKVFHKFYSHFFFQNY